MADITYDATRPDVSVVYYGNKKTTVLDRALVEVRLSGDLKMAYRTCEVTINNTEDGRTRLWTFHNGAEIRMLVGKEEVFRGIVFKTSISEKGTQTITAYDYNVYLTKSSDSLKFTDKTADAIVKELAKKFGIKTGRIDATKHVLPKLVLQNKTIFDMIVIALTETFKVNSKRFFIRSKKDALELIEVKSQTKHLIIEPGRNLISASFSESIEDRKTQVRVTGGDEENPTEGFASSGSAIKKYGVMQHHEHDSEVKDAGLLNELAATLLAELNKTTQEFEVEALGMVELTSGIMVKVSDSMTGMTGAFYISADSHTFEANGVHTMRLTLTRELELPEEDYVAPTEKATTGLDGHKLSGVDYETGWIATAYAPALGGINSSGTGLTASGTKVVEGRTIAVDPTLIPYGSVVAVYVKSMNQYSGIYLAEDTGGAIKGKHIDIAVVAAEAMKFGKREVQVSILQKGSGRADARSKAAKWAEIEKAQADKLGVTVGSGGTGKAADVVKLGLSYVGKLKYIWGGTNVPGGGADCSGFTQYIFKQSGIDIGRDTTSQIAKGTKVTKASAQPGDLIFFKNTYRTGVSHVGIVTREGYFVNLGSSGCYEASYTSGYWSEHFMEIRRVL